MASSPTPPNPPELKENLEVLRHNLVAVRDAAIAIGMEDEDLSMACQSFATAVDAELELVQTALRLGDDERVVAWSSAPRNLRSIKAEVPDELVARIDNRVDGELQQWNSAAS